MKVVKKIERKEGADYFVNKAGEVVEVRSDVRVIDNIDVKPDKEYHVDLKGQIVEKSVRHVSLEEFHYLKSSGELKKAIEEGVIIRVKEEDAPISKLEEIEAKSIEAELIGQKIEKVEVSRKGDGTREFSILLSNGKRVVLREGLLVGGASIEII